MTVMGKNVPQPWLESKPTPRSPARQARLECLQWASEDTILLHQALERSPERALSKFGFEGLVARILRGPGLTPGPRGARESGFGSRRGEESTPLCVKETIAGWIRADCKCRWTHFCDNRRPSFAFQMWFANPKHISPHMANGVEDWLCFDKAEGLPEGRERVAATDRMGCGLHIAAGGRSSLCRSAGGLLKVLAPNKKFDANCKYMQRR